MDKDQKEIHIELDKPETESFNEIKADDIQYNEENDEIITNSESAENIITTGKGTYKLKKPIHFDGKEIDILYFDLSAVSPLRYMGIVKEVEKKNRAQIVVPAQNMDIQIKLFSVASGIPTTILTSELFLKDFSTICILVYAFLVG